MNKKIRIILFGALIVSSFSLGAYAFFERNDNTAATDERLDKLIQDTLCKSRT